MLTLSTALAGCAASSRPPAAVARPNDRLQGLGVSVLPPAGDGWYVSEKSGDSAWNLMFQQSPRPGGSGNAVRTTTFVTVNVERVDRAALDKMYATDRLALEHVRDQLAGASTGRFRDQQARTTWTTLQGAECLRYSSSTEERENAADPSAVLTIRTEHACCFHPRDRRIAVWITVSRRYAQGVPDQPVDELAEAFLRNVSFYPVN